MSYSKKPMAKWKDKDVKAWVNSLDGFNDKQKKLICKGVDEIGCDGDSLESAETAEELKDALDIPIILARKLHRKVTAFKDKGDDDDDDSSDESDSDDEPKKSKKGKNKKKDKKKTKKSKKKKEESSSEEDSSSDDSSSDDSSDDGDGDDDDNEEDVLARLIARNLAKKNKIQPGSSQNAAPAKKKGGFLQWGSNNNSNNNSGYGGGGGGSSDKFIVNIQGSNGKYIQISTKCDKHTTVRQVKQYLAAQEGGDPAKMNLKFNGRNMDDHQNLGFYGIANSRNLITVSYKVVGGN